MGAPDLVKQESLLGIESLIGRMDFEVGPAKLCSLGACSRLFLLIKLGCANQPEPQSVPDR
jgi:hypothetical protein